MFQCFVVCHASILAKGVSSVALACFSLQVSRIPIIVSRNTLTESFSFTGIASEVCTECPSTPFFMLSRRSVLSYDIMVSRSESVSELRFAEV